MDCDNASYLDWDNNSNGNENEVKSASRRGAPYSRGASTLFGFKRRPASASPHPAGANAAARPTAAPGLRRTCSQDSLEEGTGSPRLSRQAKEQARPAARVNRFGFKSPVAATTNKVSDSNANVMVTASPVYEHISLVSKDKPRSKGGGKIIKPVKGGIVQPGARSPTQPLPVTGQTARFTLQTSLLPTPQFPIRLASADCDTRTKGAKTMANNSTRNVRHIQGSEESSSNGSLNADSGLGSQRSAEIDPSPEPMQRIEMLDASPGSANRRNKRQAAMRRRELEVVVTGKSFDVRDLKDPNDDPNVITEISVISLSSTPKPKPAMKVAPQAVPRAAVSPETSVVRERKLMYQRQVGQMGQVSRRPPPEPARYNNGDFVSPRSSGEWQDQSLMDEDEEKALLDRELKEKNRLSREMMPDDDLSDWGPGEAMAEEFTASEDGFQISNIQCRPVHLEIEEARFAAIAASEASMIEDERSPVDSLMSSSLQTSSDGSEDLEKDQEGKAKGSPDSPGTPTLSLSEGRDRDFLIDDEIADQPGLMFDEQVEVSDMVSSVGLLEMTEGTPTLMETPKTPAVAPAAAELQGSPASKTPRKTRSRAGSVDTLSPCESITSDDLMMDFDRSEESAFNASRVGSCAALTHLDEASELSELSARNEVFREWTSLLGAHSDDPTLGVLSGRSTRLLRSRPNSTPDSPRSLDSRSRGSGPLRPPRLPGGSESDDGASSMRLDRTTYQQMCQDIVSMKTMLLKLRRLFQEDEECNLTRAETLNPFETQIKNGLFYSLSGEEDGVDDIDAVRSTDEEVADLRRQVVFLRQQVEERERTVSLLQLQMTKYTAPPVLEAATSGGAGVNAATQTERLRPVSAGPSLLQSLPSEGNMGPLVSLNDGWRNRKSSLNARKLSSPTLQRRTSLGLASASLVASNIPTLKSARKPEAKS